MKRNNTCHPIPPQHPSLPIQEKSLSVLLLVTNIIKHGHDSLADLAYLYLSLLPPSKAQPFYISITIFSSFYQLPL